MLNRKETAWKKSRKFGDIKGGRTKPKIVDGIFNRMHDFLPPSEGQELPIKIMDNPSRDFFFPATMDEVMETLRKLPKSHTENLTHIWLRKFKKSDYESHRTVQGSFICGSGVNLIVLYPFPIDLKMKFGKRKPSKKRLKLYAPFTTDLKEDKQGWFLLWTKSSIKNYFLNSLLLHEVGHHLDSYYQRYWSSSYTRKAENFANNYAISWSNSKAEVYE